jgi:hypothetical protein
VCSFCFGLRGGRLASIGCVYITIFNLDKKHNENISISSNLCLNFTMVEHLMSHSDVQNHRPLRHANKQKTICLIEFSKQTHWERSTQLQASSINGGVNPAEATHMNNCLKPLWYSLKHEVFKLATFWVIGDQSSALVLQQDLTILQEA